LAEPDQASFDQLNGAVDQYAVPGREDSSALLIWFLEHIHRLDEDASVDAVCDGPGDKGIDGLRVDAIGEEINLLQSKRRASLTSTQGDNELKSLVGAASWFPSPEHVDGLLEAGPNSELRSLIERNEVRRLVGEGFNVRCVFVANSVFDSAGRDYLKVHGQGPPPMDGWDLDRLLPYVKYADRVLYVEESVTLSFAPGGRFTVDLPGEAKATFGAVSADQISKLPGITDSTLFAQNVRLNLGRTRVNKDIVSLLCSLQTPRPTLHAGRWPCNGRFPSSTKPPR